MAGNKLFPSNTDILVMDSAKESLKSRISSIECTVDLPSDTDTRVMDGGRQAWCTLAGAWLTMVATFGYFSAFGVYQSYYTQTTAHSSSQISWIGSTQLFLMCFCGIAASKFIEAGHFRPMVLCASLFYVFSVFMLSLADPSKYYQIFLSQGIGMGVGVGFLYSPAVAVQAHHWRARRALAMGIVITGSSTGGIFFPIMLNHLFAGSLGFAWGVRASAFVLIGLLTAANLLMRANPPPRTAADTKPDVKSVLGDLSFIVCIAGVVLVVCGLFFPYFYLQIYALLHGTNPSLSFYLLTILNGASTVGRIVPNVIADYIGAINCIIPATLACGILIFAMLRIHDTVGLIFFSVLYGFFSGAYFSLLAPTGASTAPNEKSVGLRVGVAFTIVSIGMLIGTPVDGALLGSEFAWSRGIIFSGILVLCGSGLLCAGRQLVVARRGTAFV